LIAAISIELHEKWKHAKHSRHDQGATITILNVGGVHYGMNQQALRINEDVTFLALDLLARIETGRIMDPPFSALFTLCESITADVGLASRPIASRHFT
jgi:hypothetical protein